MTTPLEKLKEKADIEKLIHDAKRKKKPETIFALCLKKFKVLFIENPYLEYAQTINVDENFYSLISFCQKRNDMLPETLSKILNTYQFTYLKLYQVKNYGKSYQARLIENKQKTATNFKFANLTMLYSKFNIPKKMPLTNVDEESLDRIELSQYLNEPVQVIGKIKNVRIEKDTKGVSFKKILLVDIQYLPTNPKYSLKKANFMKDHIWIDINTQPLLPNGEEYKIDQYLAFIGTVSEYRSQANKSVQNKDMMTYWRYKYHIDNFIFKAMGFPIIENDGIINIK